MKKKLEVIHYYKASRGDYWDVFYDEQYLGYISLFRDGEEIKLLFNSTNSTYILEEVEAIRKAFDELPRFTVQSEI